MIYFQFLDKTKTEKLNSEDDDDEDLLELYVSLYITRINSHQHFFISSLERKNQQLVNSNYLTFLFFILSVDVLFFFFNKLVH